MHIKKFRATNMTEALGLVKNEFGPDAVILSAVNIKNNRSLFGRHQSGVEVTAAQEMPESVGSEKRFAQNDRNGNAGHRSAKTSTVSPEQRANILRPVQNGYAAYQQAANAAHPQNRLSHAETRRLFAVYRQIRSQGVQEHIAMELVTGLYNARQPGRPLGLGAMRRMLADGFTDLGVSTRPIKFGKDRGKIVTLVGPTGVGKTTTAAKIAAIAKFRVNPKPVALITVDNYRVGGAAQLEKYAEIIGVPFQFVSTRKALMQSIARFKNNELILIDTPGISPNNPQQLEELHGLVGKIRHLETFLLTSASTKEDDLIRVIDTFSRFSPSGLIVTKVDESATFGAILNRLVNTPIPISYLTKGQSVPEDIETASQEKIVNLIVPDRNMDEILSEPPELLALEMEKFRTRLTANRQARDTDEPMGSFFDSSEDIFGDTYSKAIAGAL